MLRDNRGQGLVEYTLIVLLVALVFWVAVKNSNVEGALTNAWDQVKECLNNAPATCVSSK